MLIALLKNGFLPRELPAIFTSLTLGNIVDKTNLPSDFTSTKAVWTQPIHHNLARAGGLRRRLTIPNPVNYFRLSQAFHTHSTWLNGIWTQSPFSKTTPDVKCMGPRAIARSVPDRAGARAGSRVGARYILRTDIAQFYPSIYSHSIPWALHTKPVAKAAMKNMSLVGNVIDHEVQAGQLGQTKGVPIGPDTSLGIAEILLAPIDKLLSSGGRIVGGTRFIDDIEFTFRRLADADAILAQLESILNGFELQLNPTKTTIRELPDDIESEYVTDLRAHLPSREHGSRSQWIDYFNRAFAAARARPQEGVLRYAVASLQGIQISPRTWEIAQQLLWQCITSDAGSLRFVVDILLGNKVSAGLVIDPAMASLAVNAMIEDSAAVGHGSEVVWSIWAAILLKLKIDSKNQTLIAQMEDALVAVISMVARDRKVLDDNFDSDLWKSWIGLDSLKEEYWLFAYECLKRGWFPAEVAIAKLASNPNAKFLLSNGVTFIDLDAIDLYVPPKVPVPKALGGGGGGY